MLREAKEKAETSSRKNESALIESKANFEILFDDFEGETLFSSESNFTH